MTKQINKIFILFAVFVILISFPVNSFATNTEDKENTETNTPLNDNRPLKEKTDEMFPNTDDDSDVGLPEVTIDDASSWAERKGFEVIGFLQKFVQPFAVVIFILCGIMVLAGSFGNGRLVSRGLFGMFIALIMYVVVLYAPEIMDVFLGWVQS